MNLEIRREKPTEYKQVEELTREAFWNVYKPGCSEHFILHKLRQCPDFIPELSLVAFSDGRLVGSIVYSRSAVVKGDGESIETVTFGPLSVLPERQGQGIGLALIEHSRRIAADMGFKAILIYGDPEYYQRVAFTGAARYHISTPDGEYLKALLAFELAEGALGGPPGRLGTSSAFIVKEADVERFDQAFSYKKKEVTASQERFLALSGLTDEPG